VTFQTGGEQTFDVRPRPPGRILDADRGRRGLRLANPADRERVDLRRYTPSDPANRIDWNVTGRLGEAHVRTFESETARRTVIVLDHGAASARPVAAGGSSVLDHLRDAALGVVDRLDADDGAVGLVTVDDSSVTSVLDPGASSRDLSAVREALVATVPGDGEATTSHGAGSPDPAAARRAAETLTTVDSAFAAGLRPFLSDVGTRARRVADDALVGAIEREVPFEPGVTRYVLLTPGVDRVAVRTAVQRLRRHGDPVLVLLPPEEAFVEGGAGGQYGRVDAATAGARRASARQFRRELGSTDGVTAATVEPSLDGQDSGHETRGTARGRGRERRAQS
jgi:uncharacterized protein (DUF58 family)